MVISQQSRLVASQGADNSSTTYATLSKSGVAHLVPFVNEADSEGLMGAPLAGLEVGTAGAWLLILEDLLEGR